MDNENVSPKGAIDLRSRLLRERQTLLDLSTRNRLLNVPLRTQNTRTLEIIDEKATEVFRLLNDAKAMTFLPGAEVEASQSLDQFGPQPEDKEPAARHLDLKLQTKLTSESLQKRLFDIWDDARTLEQEQGVNILYLALGLLRWYDDEKAMVARHAPLVLLPVALERSSAAEKFRLRGREEPPSPNLTLQARMRADFAINIADFPDEDEVDLSAYAARVADAVKGQPRWEVLPDTMVLGFFSFAKFLMYRDLDPLTWPQNEGIDDRPLIRALLHEGFAPDEPLIHDADHIDDVLAPAGRVNVLDADSSQTVAIAEAANGRSLVIKGPPGTGKSQTITNVIAAAVASGKKVLFVAEKMAALDVVHRRLRQAGLGPLALELHSNRISKRAVLEELKRTRDADAIPMPIDASVLGQLEDSTHALNAFAGRLHEPLQPSGLSPQAILGRLARWRRAGEPGRDLSLSGARDWSRADLERRRNLVEEMAERLAALGPIPAHPWRGVGASPFDPSETERLAKEIEKVAKDLLDAAGAAGVAVSVFGAPEAKSIADLHTALAYLQLTPHPRNADREAFTHTAWRDLVSLRALIQAGEKLAGLRNQATTIFNEPGLIADFSSIQTDLIAKSGNLFRFLDGGYKQNILRLKSYLRAPLPKAPAERLKIVNLALGLREAEAAFANLEADGTGRGHAFGTLWRGKESDWAALDNVLRWRQSHSRLPAAVWARLAAATASDLAAADQARQALYVAVSEWGTGMDVLATKLDLDLNLAFGAENPAIENLASRYSSWLENIEQLSRFIAFASRGRELKALGAGALVDAVHAGHLDQNTFLPAFDGAYAESLRDAVFSAWPDLKAIDGDDQNRRVRQFRDQDLSRIALVKDKIAVSHSEGRPRAAGGIGPLGVLNAELARKRGHMPLRQLLDLAGPAIQDLKPVFMMSPLSVAQFLKPGGLNFDLLVMDEASQIEPVDALGAIARAKQIVVVGDERQLPPTTFFQTLIEEETEEGDNALLRASDTESILDLCLAKGAPYRMLNWHYRSKHQSLIAVSNREFYDSQLLIVPSPYQAGAGMGLSFHHLQGTWYDRGASRTNPDEARIVAEAVIAHAREHPEQSLGVAAFSVSQRQAILRELERLRRTHPELEAFFAEDHPEPFFVKNLENIQGDERDVIFISIGYGLTMEGRLAHNFGPLSAQGGERRLNVLITRAKLRCEVFCNFTGADIDLERSGARGVAALKLFLSYAQTGHFAALEDRIPEGEGIIEQDVARALRAEGFDVRTNIGASGFRVDVAVADPTNPERFALGIEFDGTQYRDARSASDRDRLRREVLEAHGWAIYRLWSFDWYLRPKEELARMVAIIKGRSKAEPEKLSSTESPTLSFQAVPQPQFGASARKPGNLGDGCIYEEATGEIANVEARSPALIATDVARIVNIEGPIHPNELVARMRTLSGLNRITSSFRGLIAAGVELAEQQGTISVEQGFYLVPGQEIRVRDRSNVTNAGVRQPQMLPPQEIDHLLRKLVLENYGASRSDLVTSAARSLGFAATSKTLRDRVEGGIDRLLADKILSQRDDLIVLSSPIDEG